ncbi:MAG: extracellular solute-binding protein [Clostridiales bacterium]|jgi:raffinose/stachyose/melibiose transport system substrate-binding protein|nr:extracellular solute-binding protein [Clostridiales bacterium]
MLKRKMLKRTKITFIKKIAFIIAQVMIVASLISACSGGGQPLVSIGAASESNGEPAETSENLPEAAAEDSGLDATPFNVENGAVVRFLHIYPEHADAIAKSIEIIERDYPLTVEVSVTPWNEVTKTIQTASASGEMYDTFFQWNSQVPGYDQSGLLLDLTPYFEADPTWEPNFLNEECLTQYANLDGKIMGIPLRGTGVFIIYNKTMFDENGWTIPGTEEELAELCEKIIADTDEKITPIMAPGKPNGFQMESARAKIFDHIVYMAGEIENPLRLTDRMIDWQGLYAKSGEIMKDWYQRDFFGKNPFGLEREEGQTVFFTGTASMLLCNNNELIALRDMNEETGNYELGSFMWPAPKDCDETLFTSAGFGDGWGAWAGSKYPNAAAAFLRGMSSSEVMTIWANQERCVVAASGIVYADSLQQSFADQFARSGKYRVVPDYNTGNLGTNRSQVFVDYMTDDTMTADEFERQINELTRKAIEDAEE